MSNDDTYNLSTSSQLNRINSIYTSQVIQDRTPLFFNERKSLIIFSKDPYDWLW